MLSSVLKWLRWLGAALVLVALALAAGTFIPKPFFAAKETRDQIATTRILVLSNPIHTDIAIPVDAAVLARFGFLGDAGMPISHPDVRYLIFGWGGRSFYLETPHWADLKPMPVFRALTVDSAVMHVDVATRQLEESADSISLDLDAEAFEDLQAFIEASFQRQDGKPVKVPDAGYGRYDAFYEATGRFNAIVGCNTWTAEALRRTGYRTGQWNPLPQSLLLSLRLFNPG